MFYISQTAILEKSYFTYAIAFLNSFLEYSNSKTRHVCKLMHICVCVFKKTNQLSS
jgi:hypothetical protein